MCCGSHPVCIRGLACPLLVHRFYWEWWTRWIRIDRHCSDVPWFKSDVVQSGIDDQARSEGIWRHCDIDRSNMIDFKEYLWQYAMDVSGTNLSQSNAPTGGHGQDYIKANKTQLYSAFKGQAFCNPASSPRSVCPQGMNA